MQMLAIEMQDSFFQEFLKIFELYKDKIQAKKDKNLEIVWENIKNIS